MEVYFFIQNAQKDLLTLWKKQTFFDFLTAKSFILVFNKNSFNNFKDVRTMKSYNTCLKNQDAFLTDRYQIKILINYSFVVAEQKLIEINYFEKEQQSFYEYKFQNNYLCILSFREFDKL